jgi:ankyrin repeat protein
MFYAAREGHLQVCKDLAFVYGADCDHIDSNGQTPLYYAVKGFRLETVEFLIKDAKVDVNHEDLKHETPMVIAKRTGKK